MALILARVMRQGAFGAGKTNDFDDAVEPTHLTQPLPWLRRAGNVPMLIFLDTEFTDFIDCDLISIGMVTEDGQHVFYAERSDYVKGWESDFVRVAVLPYLGQIPEVICSRDELKHRLWHWFAALPGQLQIACDSAHDRDLLWDALEDGLPPNLSKTCLGIASLADSSTFRKAASRYHQQANCPWHHALHDAEGLRHGWLACKAEDSKHRPIP